MLRCPTSRKPSACDVESAPPEMRWTRFADESAPERLEHAISVDENLPAPVRRVGIVRRMGVILSEPHRIRHLHWNRHDLHLDAERAEHRHVLPVEIGN